MWPFSLFKKRCKCPRVREVGFLWIMSHVKVWECVECKKTWLRSPDKNDVYVWRPATHPIQESDIRRTAGSYYYPYPTCGYPCSPKRECCDRHPKIRDRRDHTEFEYLMHMAGH